MRWNSKEVKRKSTFDSRWLIVAVICLISLLFTTHLPDKSVPDRFRAGGLDKLAHIAAYGIITFLFLLSLRNASSLLTVLFLLLLLSIGAIDEITQPLVNRIGSIWDWCANLCGIVLASGLYLFARSTNNKPGWNFHDNARYLSSVWTPHPIWGWSYYRFARSFSSCPFLMWENPMPENF